MYDMYVKESMKYKYLERDCFMNASISKNCYIIKFHDVIGLCLLLFIS